MWRVILQLYLKDELDIDLEEVSTWRKESNSNSHHNVHKEGTQLSYSNEFAKNWNGNKEHKNKVLFIITKFLNIKKPFGK